ncbi:fumarylacetoacetate hydrolase family protein [Thaumasiovibrio sp. DFM-14]|uniref:fumarylacetoacetate hydrolase family protein n=1 Tax=Thaumasiovibrio sp. DFM-14 TaxID=3384792 RepID=UPI0039A31E8C
MKNETMIDKERSVLGVAVNTDSHAKACELQLPKNPILYFKTPNTLVAHEAPVQKPDQVSFYTPQAELVVVIGEVIHRIEKEQAMEAVSGYTILNNFTAQEWVRGYYRPPVKAKNFDGSGALGPLVVAAEQIADPHDLAVTTKVNGEVISNDSTASYVHRIEEVIYWAASFLTLYPGDMIAMGCVSQLTPVNAGDVVEVTIDGIGTLRNTLVSEQQFYATESVAEETIAEL